METTVAPRTRLAAATVVGSLGLAAGGTSGALLAVDLTGRPGLAGVPLGMLVAGSALGALAISRWTVLRGRGPALALGYAAGAGGAALVILAAFAQSFPLLLLGSLLMGAANTAVFLARYAAADLGDQAGRAIGAVYFAACVGAVVSPNLLGPAGAVAAGIGLPRSAGLYLVAVPAFGLAGLLLAPLRTAKAEDVGAREVPAGLRRRPAVTAIVALGVTNLVMVAVMAVAPVHLTAHGTSLHVIGIVVGVHVLGMFLPSPLTGRAADRFGGAVVASAGIAVLGLGGLLGVALDVGELWAAMLVLVVIGIGWNAGAVGASTMLIASVPGRVRPAAEGVGEVAMGAAAGIGAPAAGLVAAYGGLSAVLSLGALTALLGLIAVIRR